MRQREQMPILNKEFYCSRTLHTRAVTPNDTFQTAVQSDRALLRPVLSWLTKNGPFWEDDRQPNTDDYFVFGESDVTDQGLGEAARRTLAGKECLSFSFPKGDFDFTPVEILQGLPESPLATISITNIWTFAELKVSTHAAMPKPTNWVQMLSNAENLFNALALAPGCIDALKKEPFSAYIAERVFELLRILNEFMECRNADGSYSVRNNQLIDDYFSGGKAWFSDESETNRHKFKWDLSFPDPDRPGQKVFCPWHGKIKFRQYRIHFEWPSNSCSKLRVLYIGPKITKD